MKQTVLLFFFGVLCLLAKAQQPYYNGINFTETGLELRDDLAELVSQTHTNILSYTPGVWEASKVTDLDPDNPENVLLIYGYEDTSDQNSTNDHFRDKNRNGGGNGDWNREHTYAKSLGTPRFDNDDTPGSDAHHLRPSDVQMNGNRGNRKFADGSGNAGNLSSNWYPGDEWKGDVARMMLYMYLRYGNRTLPTNVAVGTTNSIDPNMVDVLLKWNVEDPVSAVEDQRNAYHDSDAQYAQGNRNPFIDNPALDTAIWGGDPAQDRWGILSTTSPNTVTFSVYPNPAKYKTTIVTAAEVDEIVIFDVLGKKVDTLYNTKEIDLSGYKQGLYFLNIYSGQKSEVVKFVVR
ncbi:MAG: endonuclease [Leeuwenhoekiella sp.]